mgnify:FL=1
MKNIIEYFYNLKIDTLHKNRNRYGFEINKNRYYLVLAYRYEKELEQIENLIKDNKNFDQIIRNINSKLMTNINGKNYLLLEKSNKKTSIEDELLNYYKVLLPSQLYFNIDRTDWVYLWSEKIDYIEYQKIHLKGEYPLLEESINYFIGMAENAIMYVRNCFKEDNNLDDLVLSHKRIISKEFNSPINLIVDHRSRDISEYLKYLFFTNDYDYIKINQYLQKLNLNSYMYKLLYGRMLFPTFYFDKYDDIVNKNKSEKEILTILKKVEAYEDFLKNIYLIINQNTAIKKVDWL